MTQEKETVNLQEAINTLTKAVKEDSDYAWAWHCNLAMCFIDEGMDRDKAQLGADRFMQIMFGVSTKDIHKEKL